MKLLFALFFVCAELSAGAASFPKGMPAEDQAAIARELESLRGKLAATKPANPGLLADAELFAKGVTWALRYETALAPKDLALLKTALARGAERAEAAAANTAGWPARKGKLVRGFVSAIDGSTQPYGVIVPASYDGSKPMRLDVVLHGSSRPVGMSELRFGARFDEGDGGAKSAPEADYIELHPLGRVENGYRWAGETDVFEAIEAVCRNYRIDRDRLVLRGMSMGASGTWHLGLKHPDCFVALGPYCGYVDTHRFSETRMPNFVKVGSLPWYQELGLHMLDSVDYAANAAVVPAIEAIGDKDPFWDSHLTMQETMAREGLKLVSLISPGTAHVIDPMTHAEQMRRIGEYAANGLDHAPRHLRFVTWTLKYNRCHWLELLNLGEHYARAQITASVADDGTVDIEDVSNISMFAIHPPMLQRVGTKLRIGRTEIALPEKRPTDGLIFAVGKDGWQCVNLLTDKLDRSKVSLGGKTPGLQGPIDDAFTSPFLCVRGTGEPWNPAVGAWAEANLRRFEYEWARYMRGDLPVKNDTEVTQEDLRTKNLVLFGDGGSNRWIAQALAGWFKRLSPRERVHEGERWTRDEILIGDLHVAAKDHGLSLIRPSPLPGAEGRYVVLNSGHTFHEKEFAAVNYLLFPRLGDWAVLHISPGAESWQPVEKTFPEEVVQAGLFDEAWMKPVPEKK